MRFGSIAAALALLSLPVPQAVSAAPLEAEYAIVAGGLTVMEVEALMDLGPRAYRLHTVLRTRGLASLFGRGEQVTLAEGRFRGTEPLPWSFRTEGVWRGVLRRIELGYAGTEPVLRALQPPEVGEREPVPPELRRGTVDALTALVKLSRTVAETGRCDGSVAVYDGRRRFEAAMRTEGRDLLPRWRGAWAGEALRCSFEWRQVAGFWHDLPPAERGRSHAGVAWIARPEHGGPPLPVRAELSNRWLGAIQLYLLGVAVRPEGRPAQPRLRPHPPGRRGARDGRMRVRRSARRLPAPGHARRRLAHDGATPLGIDPDRRAHNSGAGLRMR